MPIQIIKPLIYFDEPDAYLNGEIFFCPECDGAGEVIISDPYCYETVEDCDQCAGCGHLVEMIYTPKPILKTVIMEGQINSERAIVEPFYGAPRLLPICGQQVFLLRP